VLDQAASEEKVAFVGFPFRSAMSSEAHFFGIVSAELITKELTAGSTPGLQLPVYDRQSLCAERAMSRRVGVIEAFTHLLSLTPDKKRDSRWFGCISESFTAGSCQNNTLLNGNSRGSPHA
jgi:hypothetical protein